MKSHIISLDRSVPVVPAGKLANAESHFFEGPLAGLKLLGFGVWERRYGGFNVTFPARQYSEHHSFTLLRPLDMDSEGAERIKQLIIEAYQSHIEAAEKE